MKTLITLITLIAFSHGAHAEKGWLTNIDDAKKIAKTHKKLILLEFTGSDWCGWCIKLDEEVFSQAAFKAYADESLVLVELDFPRDNDQSQALKSQNQALAEKYKVRGFPTILILSPEGKLLEKTGYKRGGAEAYVQHLKDILAAAEQVEAK